MKSIQGFPPFFPLLGDDRARTDFRRGEGAARVLLTGEVLLLGEGLAIVLLLGEGLAIVLLTGEGLAIVLLTGEGLAIVLLTGEATRTGEARLVAMGDNRERTGGLYTILLLISYFIKRRKYS